MHIISNNSNRINGTLDVPSDKSIAHRAFILAALATGLSFIKIKDTGQDVQSTIYCLRCLGVPIRRNKDGYTVDGVGLHGFTPYHGYLNANNSGTTARLLLGLLSGQSFSSKLIGDSSLCRRPMARVISPLQLLGGCFSYIKEQGTLPLLIQPNPLFGQQLSLTIPSAQVKSAILFAAIYANSPTTITQQIQTRDHTERLFQYSGIKLSQKENTIKIVPPSNIQPLTLSVPGDPSSAAYFIVAALLLPNSHLTITNISMNKTRIGFIQVLRRMGATILIHPHSITTSSANEPSATIEVFTSSLTGITLSSQETANIIDELPLLALIACFSTGTTSVANAQELRVKESDRLDAIITNFHAMGANITALPNGFQITGGQSLHGTTIKTHGDHRIAMTYTIASLLTESPCVIDDPSIVAVSYPNFYSDLDSILISNYC